MDNNLKLKEKTSSLKLKYELKEILVKNLKNTLLLIKDIDNNTYLLVINSEKTIIEMIQFSKIKSNLFLKPIDYGITNKLNPLNKYNNKSNKFGFILMKQNNYNLYKNVLENRKINLYEFKMALKKFLINYISINKKNSFMYNNINPECLLFKKNNFVMIDFTNIVYLENNKLTGGGLKSFFKKGKEIITGKTKKNNNESMPSSYYNKLKIINDKFELKQYKLLDNVENYDIICILWLIYITEHAINDIPKPLILDTKDIKNIKDMNQFYEKLEFLVKQQYFTYM